MAGKTEHAIYLRRSLWKLLNDEHTTFEEGTEEECDCIIGMYRIPGRLVCKDAMSVFGAPPLCECDTSVLRYGAHNSHLINQKVSIPLQSAHSILKVDMTCICAGPAMEQAALCKILVLVVNTPPPLCEDEGWPNVAVKADANEFKQMCESLEGRVKTVYVDEDTWFDVNTSTIREIADVLKGLAR